MRATYCWLKEGYLPPGRVIIYPFGRAVDYYKSYVLCAVDIVVVGNGMKQMSINNLHHFE